MEIGFLAMLFNWNLLSIGMFRKALKESEKTRLEKVSQCIIFKQI